MCVVGRLLNWVNDLTPLVILHLAAAHAIYPQIRCIENCEVTGECARQK